MSLLRDDAVSDVVEFELHESYAHDAEMEFPSDFGTEEIAAELSDNQDPQEQDILTTGISEDHNFAVSLHDDCRMQNDLNAFPASDLLVQSEETTAGQHQDDEEDDEEDEDDVGDEQPDVTEEEIVEQDAGEEEETDSQAACYDTEQQDMHANESQVCDMRDEFAEADDEFDKNLLEPEVDLIEEEQTVDASPSFQPKASGQPNVVRRFGRPVRPAQRHFSNGACSDGDDDEEDDDDDSDNVTVGKDDRRGCRSLVCDANSIIIAEMVYRCLICAHVTESIGDAQRHYHKKHMTKDGCKKGQKKPPPQMDDGNAFENYLEQEVDDELENDEKDFSAEDQSGASGAQSTVTFNVPSGLKQLQQSLAPESKGQKSETKAQKKLPGNFVYSPSPADYVPGRNANKALASNPQSNVSATRGGYVTCAVCNITKYYASVQRRYGQFTCMGCAKFFGRFLIKPCHYVCPNLGSCPLDVSPRCRACLLLACISTYNIDEKRMKIVNANRPSKRAAQSSNPHKQKVLTTINKQQSATNSSVAFAPPPLTKAPSGQRQLPAAPQQQRQQQQHQFQQQYQQSHQEDDEDDDDEAEVSRTTTQRPVQQTRVAGNMQSEVRSPVLTASRSLNGGVSQGSSALASGRKGTGCRQCSNCLSDDCGKCNYCLDKPKFGGPNTLKKKCIQKKCLLVQANPNQRIRIRSEVWGT